MISLLDDEEEGEGAAVQQQATTLRASVSTASSSLAMPSFRLDPPLGQGQAMKTFSG